MPTLNWIGKEAVVNHHQQVPFHLLKDVPELACGNPGEGNLIVQGDNLVALKALLPYYAGQVKCIYIDPPYNTGNEGWAYNDNVNSPVIREWLGKVVGKEGETLDRHDRWLCMMYPRLVLLRQFLRKDGAIFISLDDNEIASLRLLMDEIFGSATFCAQITVQCNPKGRVLAQEFAKTHEYILVYSRMPQGTLFEVTKSLDELISDYDQIDPDGRRFRLLELRNTHRQFNKETRPNLHFPLFADKTTGQVFINEIADGVEIFPNWPDGMKGCWTWEKAKCREDRDDLVARAIRGTWKVFRKAYATDEFGSAVTKKPKTIWLDPDIHTEKGQKQIDAILSGRVFYAPKAIGLIRSCIEVATNPGDLVLDSFGGSGTTGHAVLDLNKRDGGNRRFILVEMESKIARDITAERLRRVAEGYTSAKGEHVEGLGGGFRYCELGEPLFDEHGKIRDSVRFTDLARHVYFTETGEPLPLPKATHPHPNPDRTTSHSTKLAEDASQVAGYLPEGEGVFSSPLLGECRGVGIYLLYNGILGDKSANGGNVLTRAVLAQLPSFDGPKVIYCAGCLLGRDRLRAENIIVRQTPYEIKVS